MAFNTGTMRRFGAHMAVPGWAGNWSQQKLVFVVLFVSVALLVFAPLVMLLKASVATQTFLDDTFTLTHFATVYLEPSTYQLLVNTLVYAVGATGLSLLLAFSLAWLLMRTNVPLRGLWLASIFAQMGIPLVVLTFGWMLLLDPRVGVINEIIRGVLGLQLEEGPFNVYSLPGIAFVGGMAMTPTAFLFLLPLLRQLDPLMEAAGQVAGAGRLTVLRCITLPLVLPGLLSAVIWFFISAIEQFEIPGVLGLRGGVRVLSTKIVFAVRSPSDGVPNYGVACALAVGLLLASVLLLALYRSVVGRGERFTTITGKGYRPKQVDLGRWRYPAAVYAGAVAIGGFLFPVAILLWASVLPFYVLPSFEMLAQASLANYTVLFGSDQFNRALINTAILMVGAATVTVVIGALVAWFVVRRPIRGYQTLDTMAFVPFAIPNPVLAVSLILLFSAWQVGIYSTIWILVLAAVIRYMPWASRVLQAAQVQIHTELERAAMVAGAGYLTVFRRVVLPLLFPALLAAWLWVAVHAMREATSAVILGSAGNTVMASLLWNALSNNAGYPEAAAVSIIFTAVALALGIMAQRLLRQGLEV